MSFPFVSFFGLLQRVYKGAFEGAFAMAKAVLFSLGLADSSTTHVNKDLLHEIYPNEDEVPEDTGEDKSHTSEECAICLEALDGEGVTKELMCGHFFHRPCIEHWLKISIRCPICRSYNVFDSPSEDEQQPHMEVLIFFLRLPERAPIWNP